MGLRKLQRIRKCTIPIGRSHINVIFLLAGFSVFKRCCYEKDEWQQCLLSCCYKAEWWAVKVLSWL